MKAMLKDALILFVITVSAGLILGVVYQVTKEPIAVQQEKTKQAAFKEVFENAASFEEESVTAMNAVKWEEAGFAEVEVDEVEKALDESGKLLGYVLNVTSHAGYGGDIRFSMGVQSDGTLNGISILNISETAGLGMQAEEVLKPQFANKKAVQFEYTKSGAMTDNQIDAISGATITTSAITTAVNGGLYYFQTNLSGGGSNE